MGCCPDYLELIDYICIIGLKTARNLVLFHSMKLFKSWPLYVVLAVFLGYLVFSDDDSPKEGNEPAKEGVESPSRYPSRTMNQPPVWQDGSQYNATNAPSSGYQAYPGGAFPNDPALSNQYRFRPMEPSNQGENQYQPSYPYPDRQGVYGSMPSRQGSARMTQQYPFPGQEDMNYRFRPLDQARQSQRWSGNYPNPYTPPNYYTPQNRPAPSVGNDSLWAESAPKH